MTSSALTLGRTSLGMSFSREDLAINVLAWRQGMGRDIQSDPDVHHKAERFRDSIDKLLRHSFLAMSQVRHQ